MSVKPSQGFAKRIMSAKQEMLKWSDEKEQIWLPNVK